jgi:hypothetical protein
MSVLTYNGYDSSSTAIVCTSYTLRTVLGDQQIASGWSFLKCEANIKFPWPESARELH